MHAKVNLEIPKSILNYIIIPEEDGGSYAKFKNKTSTIATIYEELKCELAKSIPIILITCQLMHQFCNSSNNEVPVQQLVRIIVPSKAKV